MQETRKQTVELIRGGGTTVLEKFRAIALDRYIERHPGVDPVADGMYCKKIDLPSRGLTMCVLLRTLPAGEYDVEVNTSLETLIRE